ncbi:hypothetical protein NP493_442g01056 [Ridgeia piscesae]|uniref:Uncharacterized protein n=1 Tax=Ridgeia piscesae TaxID=27915 RepID=A0AAD9NS68_RIDPI|nr:hypothetical protein NP493_442g01056 [Ridgeia piscesae]
MSWSAPSPDNPQVIHQRYEDAALVIFRQEQKRSHDPFSRHHAGAPQGKNYASNRYGSPLVHKSPDGLVTKTDQTVVKSQMCVIL